MYVMVGKCHQQHTVTDESPGCVQPLPCVCWETADCKYESASNLSHTDDRWSPTYTSHSTSGKHPRCLTAQMCSSAQPQPPTTAWPPQVMVVKHECFYSFGKKTQQNNRQQFRLLVGLLTLLEVKAIFHIAMVSPVVDRRFHVSQQACV